MDSGGTLTERSNDAGLALDRALQRATCTYALGFGDDDSREDRRRPVTVWIRRKGLRAVHAAAYALRSEAARRESVLRAAYLAPALFDTGTVRAGLLPLRPASASKWSAMLVMTFIGPMSEALGAEPRDSEFGVVLGRGSEIVHRVERTIRLEPLREAAAAPPLVTFLEPIEVRPGQYTLTAVLSDPAIPAPLSVRVEPDLREVPRGELFLVGPLMGRRTAAGVVVRSPGNERRSAPTAGAAQDAIGYEGFQPLLEGRLEELSEFVALTHVCMVDADAGLTMGPAVVNRVLRSASGSVIGQLEPVPVALDDAGEVRCQTLMDVLPSRAFRDGGEYLFEASLSTGAGEDGADDGTPQAARFSVAPR